MHERFSVLLQSKNPGLCRREGVHPGDHTGTCLIVVSLVECLADQLIGNECRFPYDFYGKTPVLFNSLQSVWNAGLPLPDIPLHTDPVILCKTKICNPYLTAYSFLLRINALYRSFLYSKFITCMHVFTSCFSCKKSTKLLSFFVLIRHCFGQIAQAVTGIHAGISLNKHWLDETLSPSSFSPF